MPLTGSLQDISLPNLIQLQCGEPRPAQIRLQSRGREGLLGFSNGELVFARLGSRSGEQAIYDLIAWENADFTVSYSPEPLEQNIFSPWSALLLEALRRLDEARAEKNPALDAATQALVSQRGIHAAMAFSRTNPLNASVTDSNRLGDSEWVADLADRLQAIGDLLDLDSFEQMVSTQAKEKLWIQALDQAFVVAWLDAKANVDSLKALVQPIIDEGENRTGAEGLRPAPDVRGEDNALT